MLKFIKNQTPIVICDIGASSIEKTNFIEELFKKTDSKLIGFEPNIDEFKKLENNNPRKIFYDFAIGDGSKKTLNICKYSGMSSFLEPDIEYLERFKGFLDGAKIINKLIVQTKKLDDIKENIDIIKIDVQGYESEIIKYGQNKLKKTLVVQLETSPIPLYKNEKSFAFVINQLEELGFVLHMFNNIDTRLFQPMTINNDPYRGLNHLFQLDCVLIKNFKTINTYSDEELKKLILIMFYSFKSYDLVDHLIRILDAKYNTKLIEKYIQLTPSFEIKKLY